MAACPIDKSVTMEHENSILDKVDITISTYPDLQPFLEMIVTLIEGVYEQHTK
jgi:hypothetical protein